MIKIVDGNILNATEDIIGHQVNCQGVMGAGLAKQIRNKYPEAYDAYICKCKSVVNKDDLLGQIKNVKVDDQKYITHIFGQYSYGRNKRHTDYEKLKEGLKKLKEKARKCNLSVAIPYEIGCGLAGGDWNVVYKIIDDVFKDYEVTLYRL